MRRRGRAGAQRSPQGSQGSQGSQAGSEDTVPFTIPLLEHVNLLSPSFHPYFSLRLTVWAALVLKPTSPRLAGSSAPFPTDQMILSRTISLSSRPQANATGRAQPQRESGSTPPFPHLPVSDLFSTSSRFAHTTQGQDGDWQTEGRAR